MIRTFVEICTLHSDILALWLIMTVRTRKFPPGKLGQARGFRASPANYQGRRLPCWVRDVVAQLFFKAPNKVRTIIFINYQIHKDCFSSYLEKT